MTTTMHASPCSTNQDFSRFLDHTPADSAMMDLDAIAKQWARRILDHAQGLTAKQRERLGDICRPDRFYFRRSSLNLLLDLAAFATPGAATWGAEAIRGSVLRRLDLTLPTVDAAYLAEEESNFAANVAQQVFREHRSRANAEAVVEAFEWQGIASRIAADATWRAIPATRRIEIARR